MAVADAIDTRRGAPFVRRAFLQALIWGAYGALALTLGFRTGGFYSGVLLIALWIGGGLWLCSEALRALALRRRWLEGSGALLALRVVGAVIALAALLQLTLYVVLTAGLRLGWLALPSGADYRPAAAFMYWLNSAMPLALWAAGWVSVQALARWRAGEIARLKAEAARSALELDALRARLNPHFVFNALNNLRALINEDRERAREMVTRLSNTLRHALDHGAESSATLAEELAVVDDYLAIEQVHFEQRLRIERAIDPAALPLRLPPMLLQLLVENAIKHGVARTPGGGVLRIEAVVASGALRIVVENPGRIDRASSGHGVGLSYLQSRLAGTPARFALDAAGERVRATLELPQ
jgi:hypothetical protein